jgi:adenosylmethionine-8-amino-7-oxononanoate aminotransferase
MHTFRRSQAPPPVAVKAQGCEIWDESGNRYLDAAGGAILVGIGHGSERVAHAMTEQVHELGYAHATQLSGRWLDTYTDAVARLLPIADARIYPVSGGSDAVEAALKLARCYHVARGEESRTTLLSRWGSYHGNTRGALDVTGRPSARGPYEPWLGLARHLPEVNEYRCPLPTHPDRCGLRHAELLEQAILDEGPGRVAAFIAEPIVGATLAVAEPPDDYWAAVADVCRRHGVLLILDEVMTGFGRTGSWFAAEHWGIRPDILVAAKGVCSGYWPMGLVCCTAEVHDAVQAIGFPHGGSFSHSPMGSAIAAAVLEELVAGDLVSASRDKGRYLLRALHAALGRHRNVGDIRGRGLFVGIEFVADRTTQRPFHPSDTVARRLTSAALRRGLLVYPSTGCAGPEGGDALLLGPPFVVSQSQLDEIVGVLAATVAEVLPDPAVDAGDDWEGDTR